VFEEIFGSGIFNSDGDAWKTQRRTASHMFTMRQLKDTMKKAFIDHGDEIVQKVEALKPNEEIDMQAMYFAYTLDSFCDIAFGVQLGIVQNKNSDFTRAFDWTQTLSEKRWYVPWWKINRFFGFSDEASLHKHLNILNKFAYDVIASRRKEIAQNNGDVRSDLLSLFIKQTDNDGQPFSDQYLRDVVMNFVVAGRDTTAATLSWSTYLIAQHPDIEEELFKEVDKLYLEADEKEGPYDAIQNNEFLHAVVSEVLRLYPPVPKDPKFAIKEDVWPDGSKIPAGCVVVYVPWSQGRIPEIWGPDATSFRPSRWLNNGRFQAESPFKFSAFQGGPRLCLGKQVAYLEIKLMLAMLARKFRFRLVPDHPVVPLTSITLPMAHGLKMTVERRQH